MAARRDGAAESPDRPDVHPAVLRRQGQSGNRADHEYDARDGRGDLVPDARPAGKGIPSLFGRCGMNHAEFEQMDPRLEQAMTEIRKDAVDEAVVEAAATRVWERLAAAQKGEHIRGCADFQALIPEFKAGRLPEAKATLVRDHLHECVA